MRDWDQFGIALLIVLIFPLMPWLAELIVDSIKGGDVRILPQTYALTTAVYVASVGVTSRSSFVMLLGLLGCVIFSVVYGSLATTQSETLDSVQKLISTLKVNEALRPEQMQTLNSLEKGSGSATIWISLVVMGTTFITHAFERFRRHILESEPIEFPSFKFK